MNEQEHQQNRDQQTRLRQDPNASLQAARDVLSEPPPPQDGNPPPIGTVLNVPHRPESVRKALCTEF
jgi:hypothetical protein